MIIRSNEDYDDAMAADARLPFYRPAPAPEAKKPDKLRMDYINSLPQPFIAHFYGGDEWPLESIDVESGLLRIDVCGKLQMKHIRDVRFFRDTDGVEHDSETFYSDYKTQTEPAEKV